jgi:hypothetical protein
VNLKGGDYSYGKEESQKESREKSEESRKEEEITLNFLGSLSLRLKRKVFPATARPSFFYASSHSLLTHSP